MVKCFIDRKDHKIMSYIAKVFSFVLQLHKIVKECGPQIIQSREAMDRVEQIEEQFSDYTRYLYQLVKHLASKGSFKELFLRLDFNKYYDKQ